MSYHFVWCPKYRRKVLTGKVETRLSHIFVQAIPTIAPNRIIAALKGYTSHELRKEFPELKHRMPTLWTRSYFVSTHGSITADSIRRYIEEQKGT